MQAILAMSCVALVLCLAGCGDGTQGTPPSEAEAKSALTSFLVAEQQAHCRGSVTLNHLSVTRIGRYEGNMGGYPVFAAFSTTCRHGGSSETVNGTGQTNAAAAYMRKSSSGAWEAYMPEIFRQAQMRADRQMEEMLKKLQPR
jgi:hypothetical protein